MKSAKGCPNSECTAHKKKTIFQSSINYCPLCGTEPAAICSSRGCYTFLDDPSKKFCARCEAKRYDRADKIKKGAETTGGVIIATVGLIVANGDKALEFAKKITKK